MREPKISIKFYINYLLKPKGDKYPMYAAIVYQRKMNRVATGRYVSEAEFKRRDFKWLAMLYEEKVRKSGIRAITEWHKEINKIYKINKMLKQIPTDYLWAELKRRNHGNTNI